MYKEFWHFLELDSFQFHLQNFERISHVPIRGSPTHFGSLPVVGSFFKIPILIFMKGAKKLLGL
jgi:hypothetical protein